jgi:hypothetical protein
VWSNKVSVSKTAQVELRSGRVLAPALWLRYVKPWEEVRNANAAARDAAAAAASRQVLFLEDSGGGGGGRGEVGRCMLNG